MSRISRLVVLVTSVAAVVGAMAGTASAVTWDVTSTGTFDATAAPGTLSGAGDLTIVCQTTTATGSYTAGSFAGNTYSGLAGTVTFSNCSGPVPTETTCEYRFTATAQPVVTRTTTGNMDVTCAMKVASTGALLCHISASPHTIYTDNVAVNTDTLTVTTTNVTTSGAGCPAGNPGTAHLSHLNFTVSGNGPHIIRTA